MRRPLLSCTALGLAASMLAAASPAQASPYHVIRWTSGRCQVWDSFFQAPIWPTNYSIITGNFPSWDAALATKARLIEEHRCKPD
jgi:hypothetical protein